MEGTGRDAVREAIMTIGVPESRPRYPLTNRTTNLSVFT